VASNAADTQARLLFVLKYVPVSTFFEKHSHVGSGSLVKLYLAKRDSTWEFNVEMISTILRLRINCTPHGYEEASPEITLKHLLDPWSIYRNL